MYIISVGVRFAVVENNKHQVFLKIIFHIVYYEFVQLN